MNAAVFERNRMRDLVARVINRTGGMTAVARADRVMNAIWPVPPVAADDAAEPEHQERGPVVEVTVAKGAKGPHAVDQRIELVAGDSFYVTPSGCLVVRMGNGSRQGYATGQWVRARVVER